jgi:hypothetical protein
MAMGAVQVAEADFIRSAARSPRVSWSPVFTGNSSERDRTTTVAREHLHSVPPGSHCLGIRSDGMRTFGPIGLSVVATNWPHE